MRYIEIPSVPTSVIAWIHKHAKKNYWKVSGQCDWDDLIAEGYLAIAYCLNKYGSDLAPPHFMRLVQLTFNCAVIDIAKKRTKRQETTVSDAFWVKNLTADETAELYRIIAEAPNLVQKTLKYMMTEPSAAMREKYKVKNGERETTSARLARLMSLDASIIQAASKSLMDDVRGYLKQ